VDAPGLVDGDGHPRQRGNNARASLDHIHRDMLEIELWNIARARQPPRDREIGNAANAAAIRGEPNSGYVRRMSRPDVEIRDAVERFVAEVSEIAKREAMRAVFAAFDGDVAGRDSSAAVAAIHIANRSTRGLTALQSKVLAHVTRHPGQRIEQINAALGMKPKKLALPIRTLIAANAIRTTGERRGTKYFAVGASVGDRRTRSLTA
jgi:hypothetical protein